MHNLVFIFLRRLRGPLIVLILVYAISVLGLVMIPGIDDQGQPWNMDFFHAFYFVSFMGSTIGFGEVPYPFTDAQRFWVLFCIYITVFAWLYAIASTLTLLQDPALQHAVTHNSFARNVRNMTEPFYLVCGYGDTGQLVVQGLTQRGIRAVVLDHDQERINALELENLDLFVPGLEADVSRPDVLAEAGLQNSRCAGLISVTCEDEINLKVAITAKLLNPDLPVVCRSEHHDVALNMESFGTDEIVNPFDLFADRLAMALHSPALYAIHEWLTSGPPAPLSEPLQPPRGSWILCGYGRFGKAVEQYLSFEGISATIVEANPSATDAPDEAILGRGTEAVTLKQAGVEQAVGIIAGTDDDTNNLSIIMTARELNPGLFTVSRQNKEENRRIFDAAELDLTMRRSDIIARKILTLVTNPLLSEFFAMANKDDHEWANQLASRIIGVSHPSTPLTWTIHVAKAEAPALAIEIFQGSTVALGELLRDPTDREQLLPVVVLLAKRGSTRFALPAADLVLELGDRILLCGQQQALTRMRGTVANANSLEYVRGGQAPAARAVVTPPRAKST
ncbi:MAG: NAD-binding protein [Gammaproteobacteria bacterium]|nr:NAD-binding protein [Gammaproteobacteria bacterium]